MSSPVKLSWNAALRPLSVSLVTLTLFGIFFSIASYHYIGTETAEYIKPIEAYQSPVSRHNLTQNPASGKAANQPVSL